MPPIIASIIQYTATLFVQILPWWLLGAAVGALVTALEGGRIGAALGRLAGPGQTAVKLLAAAILGAASPLCMYGTIPLVCSFGRKGVPQHLLAAFMASSVLINPNLFAFSFALGAPMALLRLAVCLAAGVLAGLLVKAVRFKKPFIDVDGCTFKARQQPGMPLWKRALHGLNATVLRTAPYILAGVALTALFEAFVPKDVFAGLFAGNRGFGVLLAAGLGVPAYLCGGGTIPMIAGWLEAGMSPGSAVAFMVTGPATKFTNLGAVKIILGKRNFVIYIVYMVVFSILGGIAVDIIQSFIIQAVK